MELIYFALGFALQRLKAVWQFFSIDFLIDEAWLIQPVEEAWFIFVEVDQLRMINAFFSLRKASPTIVCRYGLTPLQLANAASIGKLIVTRSEFFQGRQAC